MFAGKTLINKICKIHHRTFQVFYSEHNKPYEELLQLDNKVSIDQKLLQLLALEVKSLMHLNPEFMGFYFNTNTVWYDMRKETKTFLPPIKSTYSVPFRGSFLWNNLHASIKIVKL